MHKRQRERLCASLGTSQRLLDEAVEAGKEEVRAREVEAERRAALQREFAAFEKSVEAQRKRVSTMTSRRSNDARNHKCAWTRCAWVCVGAEG